MKVLVCVNQTKSDKAYCEQQLLSALEGKKIEYDKVCDESEIVNCDYSACFIIGGDGTILRYVSFANKNQIPIIGINAGNLGFLTEFESDEIEIAVSLLAENKLVKDERATLYFDIDGKYYYALNDVVCQRIYTDSQGMLVSINVSLDETFIDNITGDGVIVNTPTGSTAYSLSLGGAIMSPDLNCFAYKPIAAHSFVQRSVVFSADSKCTLLFNKGTTSGLFVDGKFIKELKVNDKIEIVKSKNPTIFYRRADSCFFNKLSQKIKYRAGGL